MLFCDSKLNVFLFSDSDGVFRYSIPTGEGQWLQSDPGDLPLYDRDSTPLCFEDLRGTVWMTPLHGGFCYYDPDRKQLRTCRPDPLAPDRTFVPLIVAYYIDRQGNMWYSDMKGVGKISFLSQTITHRQYNPNFETRALMTSRSGELWMADKQGIVRIFHPDHSLRGYLAPDGRIVAREVSFGCRPYCFLEEHSGTVWIGTREEGLLRLEPGETDRFAIRRFRHDPADPKSLSDDNIYSLYEDWKGRLWIGTFGGGVNLFDPADEARGFLHAQNAFVNYPADCKRVRKLTAVGHTIMIGTTSGLVSLDGEFTVPEMSRFYVNRRLSGTPASLPANDVMDIYTDVRGRTFVITFTGGVSRIRSGELLSEAIEFENFTWDDGFSSDLFLSMIEDRDNQLWVIAENSLHRLDPDTRQIEDLTRLYGAPIYFSEGLPVRFGDDLVIATVSGLLEVNTRRLAEAEGFKPRIAFTELRAPYASELGDLNRLTELRLTPDFRNLSLSYAALDYVQPSAIKYAYRLRGLEKEWHYVGKTRMTSYLSLPVGTYHLEIRSTNSDGFWVDNTRMLKVVVPPTFWESGWAFCFWIGLFLAVTGISTFLAVYIWNLRHRIDLEEKLTDVKLRFFTDVSHELRTPLTLISSPVSEMLSSENLSERARRQLSLVQRSTNRMLQLVNQILDFRKIETNNMQLFVEQLDWVAFIHSLTEPFLPMAAERKIDFRFECSETELIGWADRDKIEKIVVNLLSNAFKYTPDRRTITLSLSRCDDRVRLSVADQGIGIPAEFRKKLFRRFESLVKENPMQPSSGIGLSLVKELVTLHGGAIGLESEVGRGSCFTVTLPLDAAAYAAIPCAEFILEDIHAGGAPAAATAGEAAETAETEPAAGEADGPERQALLIVEDNGELRGFLRDTLADAFTVYEASNGREALDMARRQTLDMVISDISMPVMDGLELVRTIKADRELCHLPIILLSARASLDARIEGLETGVDDYIPKPFSASYLKTRIRMLLRTRAEWQQHFLERYAEAAEAVRPAPGSETAPAAAAVDDPLGRMPGPVIENLDERFLDEVMAVMEEQMDNSELTVEQLAMAVHMGRMTFGSKLKSLTGLTPVEFIREIRLRRAKQLLENRQTNSSGAAYMTGFSDPNWFSKCFKKRFGVPPSQVAREAEERK